MGSLSAKNASEKFSCLGTFKGTVRKIINWGGGMVPKKQSLREEETKKIGD